MNAQLRYKEDELEKIIGIIKEYDKTAEIIFFGSRTDLLKKGGDIDIMIKSHNIDNIIKRKIRVKLIKLLGDRKIDLILTEDINKNAFIKNIYHTGIKFN
jgi:predicted nucleotidyltransferase